MGKYLARTVLGVALGVIGCSGGDEDRTGCCRIRTMCNQCNCPTSWELIGDNGSEDACDDLLDDPDVADGCNAFDGGDAILACN